MYNSQLETFLRGAYAGSFNKAAEESYITHTAVIKQINAAGATGLHYVVFDPGVINNWHTHLNSSFAHIAVNTNPDKPGVEWFDRISDAEYLAIEENAD